jgi:hypothetical protein
MRGQTGHSPIKPVTGTHIRAFSPTLLHGEFGDRRNKPQFIPPARQTLITSSCDPSHALAYPPSQTLPLVSR